MLKELALLIEYEVLARTVVRGSDFCQYGSGFGGKFERGIDRTKSMIVSWQGRLEDLRMLLNDVQKWLNLGFLKISVY